MNRQATLDRLASFQAQFGAVLRTPLDRRTGTLRADLGRYDATTCAAVRAAQLGPAERLAVYNRQYWFRLFGVLQQEYPLTARLTGMWRFNGFASEFLCAAPPSHHDLAHVGDGFDTYLTERGGPAVHASWLQAARMDAAYRNAIRAEDELVLSSARLDADALLRARLRPSSAFRMVDEDWPLVALRQAGLGIQDDRPLPLPPPHPDGTRTWALSRSDTGLHVLPLARAQAVLLRLLLTRPVGSALASLEAHCRPDEQTNLPDQVQRWLEDSMRFGFWKAIEP